MTGQEFPDDVRRLVEQADQLDHGAAQVALLEQAVRLADGAGDERAGYHARLKLVQAAGWVARPDVVLATFPWCLACYDRDPAAFDAYGLLWRYKTAAGRLPAYPEIGRGQIDAVLDDLDRRFWAFEPTRHPAEAARWDVTVQLRDLEAAETHRRAAVAAEPGRLSSCRACQHNCWVWHHVLRREDEAAVAAAEPILRGGMSCDSVPHITHGNLLLPLFRLGRLDEAAGHHRQGRRLIEGRAGYEGSAADRMVFLGLNGHRGRALNEARRRLPAVLAAPDPALRFEFLYAVRFLVEQAGRAGQATVSLPLPAALGVPRGRTGHPVGAMREWLTRETDELAVRFDTRNGNDFHARQLVGLEELHAMVRPHPL